MSKKPQRSRHRVPLLDTLVCEPISERYQIEVDMSTARLERRYAKAFQALRAAERRAEKVLAQLSNKRRSRGIERRYDQVLLLIEERRAELREIERLMIPEAYATRDGQRRLIRQEAGAITIPLGDTTGYRERLRVPTFPVTVKRSLPS